MGLCRQLWIAALVIGFAATVADAGTYRTENVQTVGFQIHGGSGWTTPLIATYSSSSSCLEISHTDFHQTSGNDPGACTPGNNTHTWRFGTDVLLLDMVYVPQLAVDAGDDCAFQFAVDAGTTMIGSELVLGLVVAVGDHVTAPIGHFLPKAEGLNLMARETAADGSCGSPLGRGWIYVTYIAYGS